MMKQSASGKHRIGIVGAGTAGLEAAIAFVRSGHRDRSIAELQQAPNGALEKA